MRAEARYRPLGDDLYCIDALYTAPEVACCYLLGSGGEYAIIETGTARSVDNILATLRALGIQPSQLRYVIPTHVHLDHAGGAGQLMRHFHAATLLVHPRGSAHLIEPSKLVDSSRRVYGIEVFDRLYGDILPVDAARVLELEDESTVSLGDRTLEVLHTRGHANHHLCLFDRQTRGWFSGDMYGISYPTLRFESGSFLLPATTPTQFDPQEYARSLDRLAARDPRCCYLTHFGPVSFEAAQVELLKRQLQSYQALGDGNLPDAEIPGAILSITCELLREFTSPESAEQITRSLLMDIELNAQGVSWRRRRTAF
jgi:glyoxylase-like metal-dependent hydrolase (beta-lactamase superfamily II)